MEIRETKPKYRLQKMVYRRVGSYKISSNHMYTRLKGYLLWEKWQILSLLWPEASWKLGRKAASRKGKETWSNKVYLYVDLVLMRTVKIKGMKKKTGRVQLSGIKSASAHSLNTCLTSSEFNCSKLATDLSHLGPMYSHYKRR